MPEEVPDAHYRRMVESICDYGVFLLDPAGRVMTWNAGAELMEQYAADEIIGKHFSTFYPAVDVRSGKPEYELRGAIETGRFEDEGWRIRKDGSRFWANVIITPVYEGQSLLGFVKVTRDLTDRKRTEDERDRLLTVEREARERAETAQQHLEAIHAMTAASVTHLDTRSLVEALIEDVSEMLGTEAVALFLIQPEGHLETIAAIGLDGLMEEELRIPIGDGITGAIAERQHPLIVEDVRYLRMKSSAFVDNGVIAMIGVPLVLEGTTIGVLLAGTSAERRFHAEDLTLVQIAAERMALAIDRARAIESERSARAETAAANEASRLRDQFLALAAHELKTPLTGLRMSAQLALRRQRDGSTDRATSLLVQVVNEADRVNHLMLQLLDAARLNESKMHVNLELTNLSSLVANRIEVTRQLTDREIDPRIEPDIMARVDHVRFGQVVTNLLDNAVKFSPADQPVVVTLDCVADIVTLAVRDYGPGIPLENVSRIFERFYQADVGVSGPGLGLGLFIVDEIVTAHQGAIAVDFPEGGGSRFTVTMPCKK